MNKKHPAHHESAFSSMLSSKPSVRKSLLACSALLFGFACAEATTLYEDNFNYATDTNLIGQAPETSAAALANNRYTRIYGGGVHSITVKSPGAATLTADIGAILALKADSDFSVPNYLNLTLSFTEGDLWAGVPENTAKGIASYPFAGVSLGFWSNVSGGDANFSGVAVDRYGNIKVSSGGILITEVDAISSLDSSTVYTLTYSVDTTSGAIASLVLSSGADTIYTGSFSEITAFTGDALNYVGFRSKGNAPAQTSSVEYFAVTAAIPESSTVSIVIGAVLTLICIRRFGKSKANRS